MKNPKKMKRAQKNTDKKISLETLSLEKALAGVMKVKFAKKRGDHV
jgi:hypothetical protein